ncbi:MAG: inositol-3-phosphate synthase [Candidatus Bathyarchaeia archaeon]
MSEVRVAVAGVGNVCSALVQGVHYHKDLCGEFHPGVMRPKLGGYEISDIRFVAAFDVHKNKVGKDLSETIFMPPNNALKVAEVPPLGVRVQKGPVLDGLGKYLKETVPVDVKNAPVDVAQVLKDVGADVLIILVPVGSDKAAKFYAESAMSAGVAVINGMPAFIANDPKCVQLAGKVGVPLIGDDVKSQIGATILHRALIDLLVKRGVKIKNTWQLNWGGDMDFYNMLERERLKTKEMTKTDAVVSLIPRNYGDGVGVRIGPADYVEFLENQKVANIYIEGSYFCDVPVHIRVELWVHDAFNSAGCLIDCIRLVKIAKDRGVKGVLDAASSYYMKKPPVQISDEEALMRLEGFIEGRLEK